MSLSEGNHKNLQAMKWVEDLSNSLHTTSWVWGGYTTDIYKGRILRDHDDVDYLTMNNTDISEVLQAGKLLDAYNHPWAVCGGWAIDLFLNRVTRQHKDVDFAVLRRDQLFIQEYLLSRGWTLEQAVSGQLVPWQPGEWIDLPVHVIWCKNPDSLPGFVELLFDEVDGVNYLYRRDRSITVPIDKMIRSSPSGIPILAPELVLLYKSRNPEDPSAGSDFRNALPQLSFQARDWLAAALRKLQQDHIWLYSLEQA